MTRVVKRLRPKPRPRCPRCSKGKCRVETENFRLARRTSVSSTFGLSILDESQEIRVYGFGLRGRHAVRKAFVGLQRAVLQQLG